MAQNRVPNRQTIEKLRQAVEKAPDDAMARVRLGTALLRTEGIVKGEAELRRATELDPECVEAWVNLGGALLSRFEFKGCVEANARAIACDGDLPLPHFNQGLGYMYLGDSEKMVACFERVVELDPEHAAGNYHLAAGLLAVDKVRQARARLNKAVALGFSPRPEFLRALDKKERQQQSSGGNGQSTPTGTKDDKANH